MPHSPSPPHTSSRPSRWRALALCLALSLAGVAAAQPPAVPETPKVLTLEAAAERAAHFLDLLREGKTVPLYALLDDFTRNRYRPQEYAAHLAQLTAPYGAMGTFRVVRREAGSPFFHVYAEAEHERARVLYHLTLSPEGQVVRFEVAAVNGEPVPPPKAPLGA